MAVLEEIFCGEVPSRRRVTETRPTSRLMQPPKKQNSIVLEPYTCIRMTT